MERVHRCHDQRGVRREDGQPLPRRRVARPRAARRVGVARVKPGRLVATGPKDLRIPVLRAASTSRCSCTNPDSVADWAMGGRPPSRVPEKSPGV